MNYKEINDHLKQVNKDISEANKEIKVSRHTFNGLGKSTSIFQLSLAQA
jgi:hypothetical protein